MLPRGKSFEPGQSGNPTGRPRVVAEIRDLARAHAPAVIEELARLALNAESEAVRVAAARELLDRGYGKAAQPLVGDDGVPLFPSRVELVIVDAVGDPRQRTNP